MMKIIKRLDTDLVSGQQKLSDAAIPYCQGEHPDKPMQTCRSPFQIRFEDHFRIRIAMKTMTRFFEFFSKQLEIINLAIINDPDIRCVAGHGLPAGRRHIQNGQPAMPHPHTGGRIYIHPRIIRPPMRQGGRRLRQPSAEGFKLVLGEESCNTAHLFFRHVAWFHRPFPAWSFR